MYGTENRAKGPDGRRAGSREDDLLVFLREERQSAVLRRQSRRINVFPQSVHADGQQHCVSLRMQTQQERTALRRLTSISLDWRTDMLSNQSSDLAGLILRLSLGIMYLAHGVVLKFLTFSLPGSAGFFMKIGLPGWLAYATFAAEAIGGLLLILGIQARWVALALTPVLLGSIIWVHAGNGWLFSMPNGGWEYPAFLIVASIVQFLLGDGAYVLSPSLQLSPKNT